MMKVCTRSFRLGVGLQLEQSIIDLSLPPGVLVFAARSSR
jgi:hypothetical protein